MNKIDKLKAELKQWEDMVPVNNMGKWSRQTRIDSIKQQIKDSEDLGPEYDGAGFTEDDRIVNGQYRVISNEEADEDFRISQMNIKLKKK